MRAAPFALLFALAAAGCGYVNFGSEAKGTAKFDKRLAAAQAMLARRDFDGARKEAAAAALLAVRADPKDPRIAAAYDLEGAAALGACALGAARERYEAALQHLEGQSEGVGELRTSALLGLGRTLSRLGEFASAEETLQRAKAALPKDNKDWVAQRELARELAEVRRCTGRLKPAADALLDAQEAERQRQGVGAESEELAGLHCELGRLRMAAGELDRAAECFDRANRIHKSLRTVQAADAVNGARATLEESWLAVNAAALVIARGQPMHVEPLFEQALRTMAAEYATAPTPRRIATQREYGVALARRGKPDAAEKALKSALADCPRVFGPKHPELAQTLLAYADLLEATRRGDEAERCRKQAGAIAATLASFAP